MLETGAHIPPAVTQPRPLVELTVHVNAQVQTWVETKELVHPASARIIAGWYRDAYGQDYAPFAEDGRITLELVQQLTEVPDTSHDKSALRAYVLASSLLAGHVWSVGSNMPGYLPEGDISQYTDREEALGVLKDNAKIANEAIEHNEVEGREDHPDCDACANEGEIGAALTDPNGEGAVHIYLDDGTHRKYVHWAVPNDRPVPATELIDHASC